MLSILATKMSNKQYNAEVVAFIYFEYAINDNLYFVGSQLYFFCYTVFIAVLLIYFYNIMTIIIYKISIILLH